MSLKLDQKSLEPSSPSLPKQLEPSKKWHFCHWLDNMGIESEHLDQIDLFMEENNDTFTSLKYPFQFYVLQDAVAKFWTGQNWPEPDNEYAFLKKYFPTRQ